MITKNKKWEIEREILEKCYVLGNEEKTNDSIRDFLYDTSIKIDRRNKFFKAHYYHNYCFKENGVDVNKQLESIDHISEYLNEIKGEY